MQRNTRNNHILCVYCTHARATSCHCLLLIVALTGTPVTNSPLIVEPDLLIKVAQHTVGVDVRRSSPILFIRVCARGPLPGFCSQRWTWWWWCRCAAVECIQLLAKSYGARTRQHSRLVHRYREDITKRLVKVDSGPTGYTRVEIVPATLGDAVWIFEHRRL